MVQMALIEIDGLPINSMVIYHGCVSHNQRVLVVCQKFMGNGCVLGEWLALKPGYFLRRGLDLA